MIAVLGVSSQNMDSDWAICVNGEIVFSGQAFSCIEREAVLNLLIHEAYQRDYRPVFVFCSSCELSRGMWLEQISLVNKDTGPPCEVVEYERTASEVALDTWKHLTQLPSEP